MPGFFEYARLTQGSEYALICLNNIQVNTIMSEYVLKSLVMPEYA